MRSAVLPAHILMKDPISPCASAPGHFHDIYVCLTSFVHSSIFLLLCHRLSFFLRKIFYLRHIFLFDTLYKSEGAHRGFQTGIDS